MPGFASLLLVSGNLIKFIPNSYLWEWQIAPRDMENMTRGQLHWINQDMITTGRYLFPLKHVLYEFKLHMRQVKQHLLPQ